MAATISAPKLGVLVWECRQPETGPYFGCGADDPAVLKESPARAAARSLLSGCRPRNAFEGGRGGFGAAPGVCGGLGRRADSLDYDPVGPSARGACARCLGPRRGGVGGGLGIVCAAFGTVLRGGAPGSRISRLVLTGASYPLPAPGPIAVAKLQNAAC